MLHDIALDKILANTCPREVSEDGEIKVFEFDLHCATARVTATVRSTLNRIQYDIINVEIV